LLGNPASRGALAELLMAERTLGRLAAGLESWPRERHAADLARREALASVRLDGQALSWDDLVLGRLDPAFVKPAARAGVLDGLDLADALGAAAGNAWPARGAGAGTGGPALPAAGAKALSAARAAVAELEAWLEAPEGAGGGAEAGDAPAPAASGRAAPAPLSSAWFAALWDALAARGAAARPGAFVPMAETVEDALREPGLLGAVEALRRLHDPTLLPAPVLGGVADEDSSSLAIRRHIAETGTAALAGRFARTAAPFLVARACGLPPAPLALSPALDRDARAYRRMVEEEPGPWARWAVRLVTDAAAAEMERARTLDRLAASWAERLGQRRRGSHLPQLLDLLALEPAVTVRHVQRRLSLSFVGADKLVVELVDRRILREGGRHNGVRVFIAADLA